jgi:anti-sigma regulatory factor (Ser/Thr protein kinase)
MLVAAYSLLTLTLASQISHAEIMQRCVLVDPNLSRIWSVANIEVGLAYMGVFVGMLFYFIGIYKRSVQHLKDLTYALVYLFGSFALDFICVRTFEPFVAMLVGDAIVMTVTVVISRQVWFQRLLGVFVPLIFLTCGVGHFLEGISYWYLTYTVNVPWVMVTADIGFAVLVNTARYPAFIRGEDVIQELAEERNRTEQLEAEIARRKAAEAEREELLRELREASDQKQKFLRDVLLSVTEGQLRLCYDRSDLPEPCGELVARMAMSSSSALSRFRCVVREAAQAVGLPIVRQYDLETAVGEAAMNALVHAGSGIGTVYVSPGSPGTTAMLQVCIEDEGSGISMDTLPKATLEPGYSSAGTLGYGFWMILRAADRIWLHTSPAGTTVVLEQDKTPSVRKRFSSLPE